MMLHARAWILVVFATLTIAGCKSKLEKAVSEETDWKDKICACTDQACTDQTYKDYKAWDDKLKDSFTEDDVKNASKDLMEKAEKIEDELRTCHRKFDKP